MSGWQISWQGATWTDDDITGAEAVDISMRCGDGWRSLDPFASPVHLTVIVGVLSQRLAAWTYDKTVGELGAMSASELLGLVSVKE